MKCMTRSTLLLLLLGAPGCVPSTVVDSAPAPTLSEDTIQGLLVMLADANLTRREVARSILSDLGPAAAPVLRRVLTRRETPSDPVVNALIRSLRSDQSVLRREALDQLLLRGRKVEADLWEAIFCADSPELVLLMVEILLLMEVPVAPLGAIVELLRTWGVIPSFRNVDAHPGARITPVRETDGKRRFGRLQEDFLTPMQVLQEIEAAQASDPDVMEVVTEVFRDNP
jgi:hypothetical protein